jgi:type II secretory pathway predicted ATPase ExeA
MIGAPNYKGIAYMPLKLKGVLTRYGIRHADYGKAILQFDGQPLSPTTASLILNRNHFPLKTPQESIKRQTVAWLAEQGVPAGDLADIWEIDGEDRFRGGHPAGVHLGQRSGYRNRAELSEFDSMEVEMLSQAAKRQFKLFRDPFQDEIREIGDVFLEEDQRYIGEAMFQTAKHGGFVAVVGESGSGKSTLRKALLERVRDLPIRVIFPQTVDKSKMSTSNICHAIINDLSPGSKVPVKLEDQARQVRKVLLASAQADCTHVLMIEEAHDLSITTLKYLKRFYEIEDGFKKLLSIILIGQPELKLLLDERRYPEAREVIRRIEIAELTPLGQQLESYVAHKLKRLNVDAASIIAADAYEAIRARWTRIDSTSRREVSQLYPLLVNNTLTRAMNRAAEIGAPLVTAELIRGM